jgi:hypothetical protein
MCDVNGIEGKNAVTYDEGYRVSVDGSRPSETPELEQKSRAGAR